MAASRWIPIRSSVRCARLRWVAATRCSAVARAASKAILASLINTAKLHELDPQAYPADVLERIVSGRTKNHQLHELLVWNWKDTREHAARAAA
jgi:hypothetical protein